MTAMHGENMDKKLSLMPNSQGIYCLIFDTFSLIFSNPKFSNQQNHGKTFFFFFNSTEKKNFVSGIKNSPVKKTNQYFDMIKHYRTNPISFPKVIEKKNCSLFI